MSAGIGSVMWSVPGAAGAKGLPEQAKSILKIVFVPMDLRNRGHLETEFFTKRTCA